MQNFIIMKKLLLALFSLFIVQSYAQVTINPANGCTPFTPTISSGTVGGTYYVWYMDNIPTDTAQTTTHTFTTTGYHSAYVVVYDNNWNQMASDYSYMNVYGFDSITSPIYNHTGCIGDHIGFNIYGYLQDYNNMNITWDFGDGSPNASGNNNWIDHQFPAVGNYTVTATCNSECGTQVETYPITISNNAPIGNVYVQVDKDSVCPGDNVYFYTPNGYDNFVMDFGDGTQEQGEREHTYSIPGTYVITATYLNACGNSASATDTIVVSNNVSIPWYAGGFSASDTLACPTTQINFYPYYSFSHYSWSFGDGSAVSTLSNPTKSYSSVGDYTVQLQVTNGCGYSVTSTHTVHIQNNLPVDPFSIGVIDSICPSTSAVINLPGGYNNESSPSIYLNFGDGSTATAQNQDQITHVYNSVGTYTVSATVVNGCGQSYTDSHTIIVDPAATLKPNSFFAGCPLSQTCPNDTAFFILTPIDVGSVLFDFGDGNTATTPTNFVYGPDGIVYAIFKHAYSAIGSYSASVQVTSPCGSSLTLPAGNINVSPNNQVDHNADFFFDQSKYYCLDEPIAFLAYGASVYKWDFGDGTGTVVSNASLVPVMHAYEEPGNYTINLIVQNNCGASDTLSSNIFIPDSRVEITTSSVSSHCQQQNGKAIAVVSGNNSPFTYSWTNGDHNFIADTLSAGIYYVTITDSKGCTNFAVATVSDQEAPTISVSNVIDANCFGEASGAIDVTLIGSSSPYTYVWSNGKTSEDINQLVAGPYELKVTDANGCISTKSIDVGEPEGFTVAYVSYPSLCGFSTGVIQTSVAGSTGPYNYLWNNGYTGSSISGLSAGVYSVTVVDANGCLKEKVATVNDKTSPIAVIDSISAIDCNIGNGANVYVSTYLGTTPYTYNWNSGATTEDLSNVNAGFYALQVTGGNGCKSYLVKNITETAPDGLSICAVTVDSITNTNKVVWEMGTRSDIKSFNIYRESSQSGLYYLVGNVSADSLHEFTDPSADPGIRGYRYKLSTVNYCDEESALSDIHKTIHLTLNQGLGNTVNLIWDNYEGLSFNEFFIWRYTTGNGWEKIDSLPSNLFSYTDLNAPGTSTSPDLYYYIEGGPITPCDPTRGAINTSRSNIKSPSSTGLPAAVKTIGESTGLLVYPNPSAGTLNLRFESPIENTAKVDIINSLGMSVFKAELATGTTTQSFDLNGVANGVYFVRVQEKNGQSIKRIVISK